MTERAAADQFVLTALNAAIGAANLVVPVFPDAAPDGQLPPYIVFGCSASLETHTNGSVLLMTEFPYTVRAYLKGNTSTVDVFESVIQDALAGSLSNGNRAGVRATQNGFLLNCKRSSALSSLTTRGSIQWRYAGGTFLVKVRLAP